jgi:Cft2 family RNA processing exonuclease
MTNASMLEICKAPKISLTLLIWTQNLKTLRTRKKEQLVLENIFRTRNKTSGEEQKRKKKTKLKKAKLYEQSRKRCEKAITRASCIMGFQAQRKECDHHCCGRQRARQKDT